MRKVFVATLVALVVVAASGVATAQTYSATIDGAQQTPPNGSLGSGSGSFTLDAAKNFSYNITFGGFLAAYPENAAHVPVSGYDVAKQRHQVTVWLAVSCCPNVRLNAHRRAIAAALDVPGTS